MQLLEEYKVNKQIAFTAMLFGALQMQYNES